MPARKPDSLHILHGTWRKDRHGSKKDVVSFGGKPTKPRGLGKDAAALWDRLVPKLAGVVEAVDAPALESLCWWWSVYRRTAAALDQCEPDSAEAYKLLLMAQMASKRVDDIGSRFGLTPLDRTKLHIAGPETDGPKGVRSRNRDTNPEDYFLA